MKQIVMTTQTTDPNETITMDGAGAFRTGIPVEIQDDTIADALTNRGYPQFREATAEDLARLSESDAPETPDVSKTKAEKKTK